MKSKLINLFLVTVVIILLVNLFETSYLFNVLNKFWVNPIASHISERPISLICLGILTISFLYNIYISKNTKVLQFIYFTLIIIFSILFNTFSHWTFYNILSQILIIALIILVGIFLYKWYIFKEKIPDQYEIEDDFNREVFAKNILKNLKSERNISGSYNIGLIGPWGSGKTHVLKLLFNSIIRDPDYKNKLYLAEVIPWQFGSSNSFEKNIITQIASYDHGVRLKSIIKELADLAIDYNPSFLSKLLPYFFSDYVSNEDYDPKNKIKELLKGKHLIVLLDDLDRLGKTEILTVLRLIRNSLDVSNIHFVVGFDKDQLAKQLFESSEDSVQDLMMYLDKFFQVKIELPYLDEFDTFFRYIFEKEFPYIKEDSSSHSFVMQIFSTNIFKLLSTPRDVENVIYSARQLCSGLENDVDVATMIMLEIIKLKRVSLYKKLRLAHKAVNNISRTWDIGEGKEDQSLLSTLTLLSSFSNYDISDSRYTSTYFKYGINDNQVKFNELKKIIDSYNFEEIYNNLNLEISNGRGADIFEKISTMLKEKSIELSKERVEVLTLLYKSYQGTFSEPYYNLIRAISEVKNPQDYVQKMYSVTEYNEIYQLYITAIISNENLNNHIVNSLRSISNEQHMYINKFLYTYLGHVYTIARDYNRTNPTELFKKINEELIIISKKYPWYLIINFIVDMGENKANGYSDRSYSIFNKFLPESLSFEEFKNQLVTQWFQKSELSERDKTELKVFVERSHDQFSLGMNLFEFEFTDPTLFILKNNDSKGKRMKPNLM